MAGPVPYLVFELVDQILDTAVNTARRSSESFSLRGCASQKVMHTVLYWRIGGCERACGKKNLGNLITTFGVFLYWSRLLVFFKFVSLNILDHVKEGTKVWVSHGNTVFCLGKAIVIKRQQPPTPPLECIGWSFAHDK